MLRAFDYSEQLFPEKPIQNAALFGEEKRLALQYVMNHARAGKVKKTCPVCQSQRCNWLFHRWDIDYYMCAQCASIFIPAQGETVQGYLGMGEMKELRASEAYQEAAEERRAGIWDEMVLWIKYRLYRYLDKNTGLTVADLGNRYWGLYHRIKNSGIGEKYQLKESILGAGRPWEEEDGSFDVILYINQLQHEVDPMKTLKRIRERISGNGLLFLSTRLGSGFDVMTLKGGLDNIFPYEHVLLPSRKGLEILLDEAGFELLEIVTPGMMDMQYVMDNKGRIEEGNLFARYLVQDADRATLMEFQRFLQKAGLSSFAQAVARRKTAGR